MSLTKAGTASKTRRDKQFPENEGCKDIFQILFDHSFGNRQHRIFKPDSGFKTECEDSIWAGIALTDTHQTEGRLNPRTQTL